MKKAVLIVVFTLISFVACLIFGYLALVVYLNWPDRPIAENIKVTQGWTELRLDHPLTFKYRSQTLMLRIKDFTLDRGSNMKEITLPDGTNIDPEIEIVDDGSNAVKMDHSWYTLKYFDGVDFGPSDAILRGKTYSVIKIRSDVPFYCEGIYWVYYDPK